VTGADAQDRLAYLAETVDLLWPGAGPDRRRVILPSARAPRLLVPARPARAAASALIRYTAQQGARDRVAGLAVAAAARLGAAALLPPVRSQAPRGETIDDHLSSALGQPVSTALALTRRRANRKPVLQVFDGRGRTLAFAKVGTDPLTRALVDAEAASLRRLAAAPLHHVTVPAVLHLGSWGTTRVLVMSALGAGFGAGRVGDRRLALLDDAMHDVSRVPGDAGDRAGDAADHAAGDERWSRVARAEAAQAERHTGSARVVQWLAVFDQAADVLAVDDLELGTWHGDWTEWNCSARRDRVSVWDWERCEYGVPVGFDKLHFSLNQAVGPRRDRFRAAATDLIDAAPRLLDRWQVDPRKAKATAVCYVLHLAFRYVRDAAPALSVGSRVEDWAYPAVRAALAPRTEARR
jgi:hypothetical protein